MKTPIDFGKDFLYKLYDQRDADACQKMLAGDLVWITPENMHHFLSEGAVLKYLRKQDVDGEWGINSDNALRHVYNVRRYTKSDNFSPEEFKCECGGKYCTGYPSYMKKVEQF